MNEFLNKNKIKLVVLALAVVMLVTSASYAWFAATVRNDGTPESNIVTTGNMEITYSDGQIIGTPSNMIPGQSITKSFTVRNTGSVETQYVIYLSEVINTFNPASDLEYKLEYTSTNGYATNGFVTAPTIATSINNVAQSIGVNELHEYTLTIRFKETNLIQDDNKGKRFEAKLQINQYQYASQTITFHLNNGEDDTTLEKDLGFALGNVDEPTKTNYVFGGWYSDSNLTNEVTSDKL